MTQPDTVPAPLVEVIDLKKYFDIGSTLLGTAAARVRAVDGVSLKLMKGEAIGIVGESGCGKSTLGKLILRLIQPTSGRILLEGNDITALGFNAMLPHRRNMQVIHQDPFSSLSPRMTAERIVGEPLLNYRIGTKAERNERVRFLFAKVGLSDAHLDKYPHEFSGGQRQRLGIARALAMSPRLIICDEATSALDVSVRAQIINLLLDLQSEFGLSYIFISHDMATVQHVSHSVAVMYLGKIVETGRRSEIFRNPGHPYTQALLGAFLAPELSDRPAAAPLKGDVPSAVAPPSGCRFRTRCPHVFARCSVEEPRLRNIGGQQQIACHLGE